MRQKATKTSAPLSGHGTSGTIDAAAIARLCGITAKRTAFWDGRKVLITGATGMLGSWMTHALVQAGAKVTILVRDWSSRSFLLLGDTIDRVDIVQGRLQDLPLLRRAFSKYEFEFVFHLGAQTQVRTALRDPIDTFESNVRGTWNVLEAARSCPSIKGVLVASSDKAYGTQEKLPYDEKTPVQGEFPYDVSKSCTDLLARSYFLTYGLPVCVTRCGNLYGPGDRNFERIIPGTIRSVLAGETPVIRSDGMFVRDYLFTPDAVDGYLTVAEAMHRKEVVGQAFNLSLGVKLTVIDLFRMIIARMGSSVKPKILNQASNEIREQYLSSQKILEELGWAPRHTMEQGLDVTIAWYRESLKRA